MNAVSALLELRGISKRFGASRALTGVDFSLRRGEIHALCGENGAGKSTLMNIIDGIHQPDEGTISLDGQTVVIDGPAHAMRLGIGLVHQEIALCGDATVAENIFMPEINAGRSAWMNYASLNERAAKVLQRLGQDVDPAALVKDLSISTQQLIEIAKALTLDCKVLILDEPTAALGVKQSCNVLKLIHKARERGISVIFITHNVHHAYPIADSFTLLNRGQSMGTFAKADISKEAVLDMMAGGTEIQNLVDELEGRAA